MNKCEARHLGYRERQCDLSAGHAVRHEHRFLSGRVVEWVDNTTLETAYRTFDTGASRDTDTGKLDFEGFLSPAVLVKYAEYMNENRVMKDGSTRASDNWQKGIPLDAYMKSLLRHVFDLWLLHRGVPAVRPEDGETVDFDHALGGILFNAMGYWFGKLEQQS